MRTNASAVNTERTYEGGMARSPKGVAQLERQVATCMLWEDTFYTKGSTIAAEITETCKKVAVEEIAEVAIRAREDWKLRHVPLFLLAQLDLRRGEAKALGLVAKTVPEVVQRADELAELLSIVQKVNAPKPLKKCLSAQMKKGLAAAFQKFSGYALAKYNRDRDIKLRDVLFLVHAKPKDQEQAGIWKKLVDGTLESPDTWEVALSAGADKKATWERLLGDEKLGYMALLMNLRNMTGAGVEQGLVERALLAGAPKSRALPFRFVSAVKAAPGYAQVLSDSMLLAVDKTNPLTGTTLLLVDVSGSMDCLLSMKGTLNRWEAAGALAILLREVCESVGVFTFSTRLFEVANYRGLPLLDKIDDSQDHQSTYLAGALKALFKHRPDADRIIVVTDEQTQDGIIPPAKGMKGYLVNVAPYKPGLEVSGGWTRVNGFSERVVDFIRYEESKM